MAKQEVPLLQLQSYLPEGSFEDVHYYLQHYKVHLTITRQRQSILGDYRHAYEGKAHRISGTPTLYFPNGTRVPIQSVTELEQAYFFG